MDATKEFFQELEARGHEPLLEKAQGTMRFDLANGKRRERWLVEIDKGDIAVSHRNASADCVVRADRKLFENITTGRENTVAAVLRGAMEIEGNRELIALFQRVFPAPPKEAS
jgi:putative sterol carrier protein